MTMQFSHAKPAADYPEDEVATYDARALVKSGGTARIVLDGTVYVLRVTRAGKLILTK
jgi:hemin uptake protein HemP